MDAAVRGATGAPEGWGEVEGDPVADGVAVDLVLDLPPDEVVAEGPGVLPSEPVSAGEEVRVPVELATRVVGLPAARGSGAYVHDERVRTGSKANRATVERTAGRGTRRFMGMRSKGVGVEQPR